MSDYVLQVNFGEGEEPLRITLHGYSPGDAETAHQSLEAEIERARTMNAPVVFSAASGDEPTAGVPIDPARVSGINLIEPTA